MLSRDYDFAVEPLIERTDVGESVGYSRVEGTCSRERGIDRGQAQNAFGEGSTTDRAGVTHGPRFGRRGVDDDADVTRTNCLDNGPAGGVFCPHARQLFGFVAARAQRDSGAVRRAEAVA